MYVYSKKYEADSIVLPHLHSDDVRRLRSCLTCSIYRIVLLHLHSDDVSRIDIRYVSDDNIKVDISFVDLKGADGSIFKLLVEVC